MRSRWSGFGWSLWWYFRGSARWCGHAFTAAIPEAREAAQAVEEKLNALEGRHDIDPKKGATAQAIVEVQEALLERSEPVLAEVREQNFIRNAFLNRLRFVSPAILAQVSLEDIAGAGNLRHDHFDEEADAYHDAFRAFFVERVKAGTSFTLRD